MNRSGLNGAQAKVNSSKENLKHTKWECKFHVVFIPKYRRKVMYGSIRRELGPIMRELAEQQKSEVEGVHQGKECASDRPKVYGSEEALCWVEFLGERILPVDGGAGRDASAPVHPRSEERTSSARSTKDV